MNVPDPLPVSVSLARHINGLPDDVDLNEVFLAGEDFVHNRLLVTLVDWEKNVLLGARMTPHRMENGAPVELSREDLVRMRDAAERALALHDEIVARAAEEKDPHGPCPDCREDCIPWVADGARCGSRP